MTQNNRKRKLRMTFDPLVIDDLGAKLYSTLPPIIAEFIANGYDACAKKIWVELVGTGKTKSIIIEDNGVGMNFNEVNEKYLRIGRKRRIDGKREKLKCGRLPIGKKGLGKLAFFGIAKNASIETKKEGEKIIFEMDWEKIQKVSNKKEYDPYFSQEKTKEKNGTKIILTKIDRRSDFNVEALKKSISNYFIFDKDFSVFIKGGDDKDFQEIDNELRYKYSDRKEDFSWVFPEEAIKLGLKEKFPFIDQIKGKIILFDKPVKDNLRGVTLFSRKKLVSVPESFPIQGSSHFFQYLTGWLEVDFIDTLKPDVIATNRSSLNWNDENLEVLKEFLEEIISHIHKEWRRLIKERTNINIEAKFKVNPLEWKETNKNNPTITKNINRVLKILDDPENIEETELLRVLEVILDLIPNYADFVLWRNLHPKIKNNTIIKKDFENGEYLQAAKEAVQIYNDEVKNVSGEIKNDRGLMEFVFGKEKTRKIWITDKKDETDENIDEGQKWLSVGIMTGFKNPAVSHTSRTQAAVLKYFSDRNCLDILSIISYLFDRLEKRKKPL